MLTPTIPPCSYVSSVQNLFRETIDDESQSLRLMTSFNDDLDLYFDLWKDCSSEAYPLDTVVPDTDDHHQPTPPSGFLLSSEAGGDQTLDIDLDRDLDLGVTRTADDDELKRSQRTASIYDDEKMKMETDCADEALHHHHHHDDHHQSSSSSNYELRIEKTCRQLNISNNPLLWTDVEVRFWCDWALSQYQVHPNRRRMLLAGLHHYNGIRLSQLGEKDFVQMFQSAGIYINAELELWKNAAEISSAKMASEEFMSLGHASSVVKTTESSPETLWSSNTIPSTNGSTILTRPGSTSADPTQLHPLTSWCTIPTFVLDSVLNDDDECSESIGSTDSSSRSNVGSDEWGGQSVSPCSSGGHFTGITRSTESRYHGAQSARDGSLSLEIDDFQPYSKTGQHLWLFLQELLKKPLIYEDCIRWIDRRQGIFKIEDSVRVAKLWGQRKNRPAMNYDKLSRSIRQYYKKGIIQKTNDSRRLVYQFCPKYL